MTEPKYRVGEKVKLMTGVLLGAEIITIMEVVTSPTLLDRLFRLDPEVKYFTNYGYVTEERLVKLEDEHNQYELETGE